MSRIRGIAIFDKHGRAFATSVGDSNCLLLADSNEILGEVNHRRGCGYMVRLSCWTARPPVAQTLVIRGPGAVQTLAQTRLNMSNCDGLNSRVLPLFAVAS